GLGERDAAALLGARRVLWARLVLTAPLTNEELRSAFGIRARFRIEDADLHAERDRATDGARRAVDVRLADGRLAPRLAAFTLLHGAERTLLLCVRCRGARQRDHPDHH